MRTSLDAELDKSLDTVEARPCPPRKLRRVNRSFDLLNDYHDLCASLGLSKELDPAPTPPAVRISFESLAALERLTKQQRRPAYADQLVARISFDNDDDDDDDGFSAIATVDAAFDDALPLENLAALPVLGTPRRAFPAAAASVHLASDEAAETEAAPVPVEVRSAFNPFDFGAALRFGPLVALTRQSAPPEPEEARGPHDSALSF